MITRNAEAVAGVALVAFAAFAWYQSYSIRGAAAFFPSLVIVALGFFSLVYLGRSLAAPRILAPVFQRSWVFVTVFVLSVIYAYAVVSVGYLTSTIVYIPLIAYLTGFRRPVYLAVATLTYMVCVYVLFEIVFRRPLPSEMLLEYIRSLG